MKHVKALSRDRIPALAGIDAEPPTLQDCLSYLRESRNLPGFKECLSVKKNGKE